MIQHLEELGIFTNIFNRMARSCLYGAANAWWSPACQRSLTRGIYAACEVLLYEQLAYGFDAHSALAAVDEYAQKTSVVGGEASKAV